MTRTIDSQNMTKSFIRKDYLLAALLVTLITIMIIPLPHILMDTFIGLNITLAVLLLMVSIYLKSPSDFTTFPSIILYGTAFRLAISIATTRLILTEASAGQIIDTFGKFVISGNIIVGLVIFLIITIVQFVVITKGSERVAEVAARFCLDAMPGKQMSIDVQVRSGALSEEQGIAKRAKLDRSNQFFGAMDGAMKFVKGDAMAGLIITAINLIGGIAVGMIMHGFSLGQSATVYSLLTIGDGLVAQIPALFMSLCAATLVTRITDADSKDLGTELFGQLAMYRQALIVAGTVVLGMALIPGFPWIVFVSFAAILYVTAYLVPESPESEELEGAPSVADDLITTDVAGTATYAQGVQGQDAQGMQAANATPLRKSERIILYLSKELQKIVDKDQGYVFRDNLYREWAKKSGVEFPVFDIVEDSLLAPYAMRVEFDGVPAIKYTLPEDSSFFTASPDIAPLLPKGSTETEIDWLGPRGVWVPNSALEENEELLDLRVPVGHAIMEVPFRVAEQFSGQLFSRVELGYFLRIVEAKDSDLISNLIETLGLAKLHNILRKLIEDGVPLAPQRVVLETLYHWIAKSEDADLLVEAVRAAMHRQISYSVADDKGIMAVILLSAETENQIRQFSINAEDPTDQGIMFPPHVSEEILTQFYTVTSSGPDRGRRLAVVTSTDIRRIFRNFLVAHNIHYPVISYQEISNEIQPQPVAMIRLNEEKIMPTKAA